MSSSLSDKRTISKPEVRGSIPTRRRRHIHPNPQCMHPLRPEVVYQTLENFPYIQPPCEQEEGVRKGVQGAGGSVLRPTRLRQRPHSCCAGVRIPSPLRVGTTEK